MTGTSLSIDVLDALAEWRTWADLSPDGRPRSSRLLRRLVQLMVQRTLVIRSTDKPRAREDHMTRWGTWNPAAGFFHNATKDVQFARGYAAIRSAPRASGR